MSNTNTATFGDDIFNFVVVAREAQQVFVLGDFNNWSTSATPMRETEQHVWQLSLRLPNEPTTEAPEHRFSYFVIDQRSGTGRAPFGSMYLLPGTWAAVVRTSPDDFQSLDMTGAGAV